MMDSGIGSASMSARKAIGLELPLSLSIITEPFLELLSSLSIKAEPFLELLSSLSIKAEPFFRA